MKPFLAAGLILVAAGAACLLFAPSAVSCITDGDSMACETIGAVILNVAGWMLLAVGASGLLSGARATR
jgi:hypothetical protein